MSVIAEALTPEEVAEVEAQLGLSGFSNLPPIVGGTRSRANKLVITYDEVLALRELEVPLDEYWVYAANDINRGLVPATKIGKWLGLGYIAE